MLILVHDTLNFLVCHFIRIDAIILTQNVDFSIHHMNIWVVSF